MRQFFILVFAFFLGGCTSAKDIGGMYHLISDDPGLQRVTLEIENTRAFQAKAHVIDILDQSCNRTQVRTVSS